MCGSGVVQWCELGRYELLLAVEVLLLRGTTPRSFLVRSLLFSSNPEDLA